MESSRTLVVSNSLGLHARAAARIVKVASQYSSRLYLSKGDHEVDGSSILSILTLSSPRGTEIRARAVGEDSLELLDALSDLVARRFEEEP